MGRFTAAVQSPRFKRTPVEFAINLPTNFTVDKIRYHLINNVFLPTKSCSTQLGHIIVSEQRLPGAATLLEKRQAQVQSLLFLSNTLQKLWVIEIAHGLLEFISSVHDEWSVLRDRFMNRVAAQQQ